MNGDEASRIVSEVASLKAMLVEREHGATEFRGEVRAGFLGIKDDLLDHMKEDTRRFDASGKLLDEKVVGLYDHLQKQADAQRTRAWIITSIALTAFFGLATALITMHKAGIL